MYSRSRRCLLFTSTALCLALALVPGKAGAASPPGSTPPSNWYQTGAYGGHAGSNDFETTVTASTAPGLTTAWSRRVDSAGPLVVGSRVWTVGNSGVLRSYALASGRLMTTTSVGGCTGAVAPVTTVSVVMVPMTGCGNPSQVRAFATSDGRPLWQHTLAFGLLSATVQGGVLYLTGNHGSVSALDASTGKVRWSRSGAGGAVTASAVSGGILYTSGFEVVQGRKLTDGSVLWTTREGESDNDIAAVGDRVYVGYLNEGDGAGDQFVTCLSSTGAELWTAFVDEGVSTPTIRPAVTGSSLVVSTVGGEVVELDSATGKPGWTATTESNQLSAVSLAGGVAYTIQDNVLYGRDLADGHLLVHLPVAGAAGDPVIAAGHVLVGGGSLRVFAPAG